MLKKPACIVLVVCAVSCLAITDALAQATTGIISGVLKDATGGVLPAATVTVTNVETGIARTTTTDVNEGRYEVRNLAVGEYEVKAEMPGFQAGVRNGIRLTVGREAIVDFTLSVGAASDTVTVTGEAPLINVRNAVMGGLVDERAVRELPLNGRSFIELASLQAGVSNANFAGVSDAQGFGKKISISGGRFTSNLFLLDGAIMNDSYNSAGSVADGGLAGVEAVQEFSVVVNAYSAEYGRHTGGVVNAVTKSGTNTFHGSLYEFHRNDSLDARNFFTPGDPPEFERNQFGFSLGGPLARGRSFFFANYEALREQLGLTDRFNVPNADARRGFLPHPVTGQLEFVGIHPEVAALMHVFPLPNGRELGDGRAEFTRDSSRDTESDYVIAKIDHRWSGTDSFSSRYSIDDAQRLIPSGINTLDSVSTRNQYLSVAHDRIFSPTLLNRVNLSYSRTNTNVHDAVFPGFERLSFTDYKDQNGAISVSGLGATGGADPKNFVMNNFQLKNDLIYTTGKHALKFGMALERHQHNAFSASRAAGQFNFFGLREFLAGRSDTATFGTLKNLDRYFRQTVMGFYVQDDFRVRGNLTVNLGVRYENISVPTEKYGRVAQALEERFSDPTVTQEDMVIGEQVFQNPSLKNFAPRVGFAWDPTGSGRTSVRGGVGMFHEQMLFWMWKLLLDQAAPFALEGRLIESEGSIDFPDAFYTQFDRLRGTPRYEAITTHPDQPYVVKYSLEIQREIRPNLAVKIGGSAMQGRNQGVFINPNSRIPVVQADGRLFFPRSNPVTNPNFGRSRHRVFDGESDYFAFRLELIKNFSAGFQFQGAYTLSKGTDSGTSITGSTDFRNESGGMRHFSVRDKGLSSIDNRQNFTFNVIYELPGEGALLGGWTLNGIARLSSGQPFSIITGFDRQQTVEGVNYPNLVPGASNNPVRPGNHEQYFDPAAFALQPAGFLGDLGRNTALSPGLATVDFSVAKNTPVKGVNIQFRAEFFNLLNRVNLGLPVRNVFNSNGTVRADAGRITSTLTTARQIQLGLRLIF